MPWSTAPLADLCEINIGRTPSRSERDYWGIGHAWLSIADMNQGRELRSTKEQITDAALAGMTARVPVGTVLLSFKLSVGKVGIARAPLYTNEAIAALPIRDATRLTPEYLYWALGAMDFSNDTDRAAMGQTLNKAKLAQIRVPLPPIEEQRRIADILDRADALRVKRREALALLDDLTQSIFLDMFGVREFERVSAGELMPEMRNGLSPATAGEHPARVLTLTAVTQGAFDPGAVKSGLFAIEPPADKRVSAADFLMCRGNGNKALVGVGVYSTEDRTDLVFPDTVIAGRVDPSRVELPFLNAAWRQPGVRGQIEAAARTTNGTYKVNQQTLSAVTLPLPPLELQHQFAQRVCETAPLREWLSRALDEMNDLFATLQQRAFRAEL